MTLRDQPKPATANREAATVPGQKLLNDVRAYISRQIRESQDVDDIAQSVCLALVGRIVADGVIEKPFGYARKVADRELWKFSALRAEQRKHLVPLSDIDLEHAAVPSGNGRDPAEELAATQEIDNALAQLPPRVAAMIILSVRDGLTYAQVAQRTQMTENAVKKSLARAREQLRQTSGKAS